jgi:hypothetical protein
MATDDSWPSARCARAAAHGALHHAVEERTGAEHLAHQHRGRDVFVAIKTHSLRRL